MRQLTSSKVAQEHLDALTPLVNAKLKELAQVITLNRHKDFPSVVSVMDSGKDKQLMESIRAEMLDYIKIEERELAKKG